jgi:two-component system invasion response regulator UvrY
MKESQINLALIDDHSLFRNGLKNLLQTISSNYHIVFEASNGIEMKSKLEHATSPDLIIMDINMPEMDGFDSVSYIKEQFPHIPVLIISMVDKEESIVKMLKLGVKGYLGKDIESSELNQAIHSILNKGFYYTDFITGKLINSIQGPDSLGSYDQLSDREKEFINLACTEMTYFEIADKMCLSPKTVDGYRSNLFEKFGLKSRVGLAMLAVRNKWVELA